MRTNKIKMYFKIMNILILLIKCISSSDLDTNYGSIPELFHMDNYDLCMLRGDAYCSIDYYLEPINEEDPPEIWNFIKNISSSINNYNHHHLRHLICVPHSCPGLNISVISANNQLLTEALETCYNEKYKHLQLKGTVKKVSCETNTSKHPIDRLDIICGILFLTYVSFVLFATFYEVVASHKSSEDYQKIINTPKGKILAAFSISQNWNRLKAINLTPETRKLMAIQGIRFYNSAIVILAHIILSYYAAPVSNTRVLELMSGHPFSIFFSCGHLCMSTFFFISSFLLAYQLFTYLKDKESFCFKTMLMLLLHRLMRLLPPLIVIILFHATWNYHWGNGPAWNILVENEYLNCRKYGWTNLLFINNIVHSDHMCLPSSWFLALSMQYFVISLLYIWLLKKYEKHIWYILSAGVACNIVGAFLQNYYYDFPALLRSDPEFYYGLLDFIRSDFFSNQLGSFIGNMAGLVNGTAFGYFYYKREIEKPKDKIFNTKFRIFWFWISLVLGLACVVVPGFIILCISNEHDRFWASIYVALSRPAMCIFVGTFLLGFSEGVGWIAKRVCEWPPTYILSRLSYCVYLVHAPVCMATPALLRHPVFFSYFSVANQFYGHILVVYIVATIFVLFFEMPISALQKLYFPQNNRNSKKDD